MAGFSGAPPYGGPFNNSNHYGAPFQQNQPIFNNMIPPPPHYGQQQQHQQQLPFQQNYPPTTGQIPYANLAAFQNNAQYPPPQFGQIPYPPIPPPPFYNNHNGYGNNMMYGNGYVPNGVPQNVEHHTQSQQKHDSLTQNQENPDYSQNTKQQQSPLHNEAQVDSSTIDGRRSPEVMRRPSESPPPAVIQLSAHSTNDRVEDDVVALSSTNSSQGPTPLQADIAPQNGSSYATQAAPMVPHDSNSSSGESFDPYSIPQHQSLDGGVDIMDIRPTTSKQPASLPGLGSNIGQQPTYPSPKMNLENTRQEKKTLAIQAIQDLASRRIGFERISKEEIDLDVLRELYLESGVPMELPVEASTAQTTTANLSTMPKAAEPKASQVPATRTAQIQNDPPTITAVPNFNLPLATVAKTSVPITQAVAKEEQPKLIPSVAKDSTSNIAASSSTRQDYLAKLQAAKEAVNNKPTPPPAPAQTQDRSSYLAKLQAAKEAVKQAPAAKQIGAEIATSQHNNTETNKTIPALVPKAIKDALIRQKLEALRRTQATSTGSKPTELFSEGQIEDPESSDPKQRPASSGQPSTVAQLRTPLRTFSADQTKGEDVAFFSPTIRKGFVGGIPGLPGLSSMPATPTILQPQDVASHGSGITQPYGDNNSLSGSQTAPSTTSIPGMNGSLIFAPITTQQPPSETRSSQKRPVAADFIGSPPAKQQRRDSAGPSSLIIDVSDGEEGDRMESVDDLIRNATVHERRSGPDLPAFSDFPSRSNSYNTPPQILTPDLQAKEDAIRELKQRILAATLRKDTKVAPSTNGTSTTTPLVETEQTKALEDRQEAIKDGTRELTVQEKALAAAKLQAQKHLEQIRRNQASLNAHANKTEREIEHTGPGTDREQKLKRRGEIEAKLASIESTIATTEADLAVIRQRQEELLTRIQQGSTERATLMDELTQLLRTLEAEANESSQPIDTRSTALPVPQNPIAQPVDQEIIHQDENHDANHAESDPADQEPIQVISSDSDESSRSMSPDHQRHEESDSGEVMDSDDEDHEMQIDEDSADNGSFYDDDEKTPDDARFPSAYAPNDQDSEDSMDDYEPLQDIEVLPHVPQDESASQYQGPPTSYQVNDALMEKAKFGSPSSSDNQEDIMDESSEDSDDYEPPEPTTYVQVEEDAAGNTAVERRSSSVSQPRNDPTDSMVEPVVDDRTDRAREMQDENIEDFYPYEADEDGAINRTVPSYQHFVPYESALRQFVSYRFHPEFLQDVPGGFRSLTYNHNINPRVELCRWELAGGICNDRECESQHFKDMALTGTN